MKAETLRLAVIGLSLFQIGCADKGVEQARALARPGNHLTILDDEKNVLVDERLATRGLAALNITIREGREDNVDGVFVQFNTNKRIVPWADFLANPLGQRIPNDTSIRAGELALRLAEESCRGSTPLLFQVRELRAAVRNLSPAKAMSNQTPSEPLSPENLTYTTLSGWRETGLYAPSRLVEQAHSRKRDARCPAIPNEASNESLGQALDRRGVTASSVSNQHAQVTITAARSPQLVDSLPKRRRNHNAGRAHGGNGR